MTNRYVGVMSTHHEPTTPEASLPSEFSESPLELPSSPPASLREGIVSEWMLDASIAFLNHGCFGARPRTVATSQQRWRERIDARPIEWLDRKRSELLNQAKQAVGAFIGANPNDFGFITNATGGVNAVLRSVRFEPGDEVLTVNHVYNAVRMSMRHLARQSGAVAIEAELPFPLGSPSQVLDVLEQHLTDRTKLLIIDHITSPTALVLPIEAILDRCAARGVDVMVDGAHAPGMVELDLESLAPAYYTGNLHKWACAPLGTAFLWVQPDKQHDIHPLTISHFLDQGLAAELSWQGTRDISGWLAAPDALEYMNDFGWDRVRAHNHQMARWATRLLCEQWQVVPTSPADGSMLGSMVTLPLPAGLRERFELPEHLQAVLYDEYAIEVPIIDWNGSWWTRASCQIYNTPEQYERLAAAMLACRE